MTRASSRRFFFVGTALFTLVFIGLTVDTHRRLGSQTHAENITPEVSRGLRVWGRYNCENCHTLLGEGAYYAPDLTKIVSQRGEAYLELFLADPSRFYSEARNGRLMPTLGLSPQEISDVLAFLGWVGQVDTNGWPPRPIMVSGVAIRDVPDVSGSAAADDPVSRGKALFNGSAACSSCHSIAPGAVLVGPSLAGVGARAAAHGEGYLRQSILEPSAYLVPGERFATPQGVSLMPATYAQTLTPQQVDDLVAYLKTL
ncbi:MAG TPA: cytochrome c [Myxococcota bacterium]|nr:cytochrome c [Myxococcota bacterium]